MVTAPTRPLQATRSPSTTQVGSTTLRNPTRDSRASSKLALSPGSIKKKHMEGVHFLTPYRFDSSRSPGRGPLNIQIGVGQVIKGKFPDDSSSDRTSGRFELVH